MSDFVGTAVTVGVMSEAEGCAAYEDRPDEDTAVESVCCTVVVGTEVPPEINAVIPVSEFVGAE